MMTYKKHLVDKFQEHLEAQYNEYCNRHGMIKDEHQLIGYLIDQALIPESFLRRYTVIREYEKLNSELQLQKTQAVETIASKFSLSERTIWSILKHNNTKHK
jgi:hypothetical protein